MLQQQPEVLIDRKQSLHTQIISRTSTLKSYILETTNLANAFHFYLSMFAVCFEMYFCGGSKFLKEQLVGC